MEQGEKRSRGKNWGHAQTIALAELKREASRRKDEGRLVWEQIARMLSRRFPDHPRSGDQCRRRWDTLVKVYNHIEDYCVVTGTQDHRDLDEGELASMKLNTAYGEEWYEIVKQVCSQRKRKERFVRDPVVEKRKKAPSTGSHSVNFPGQPPNKTTCKSVAQHEQSTTTCAQVSSSPIVGVDSLRLEEGVGRLQNGSMLTEAQTREHGQGSQENQISESFNGLPQTSPVELGSQMRELQQDQLWDLVDAMPFTTPAEAEQSDSKSDWADSLEWDGYLSRTWYWIIPHSSKGSAHLTLGSEFDELGSSSISACAKSRSSSEGSGDRTHVLEFDAHESSLSNSFSEYEIGFLSPEVSGLARLAAKLGPGTWVSRLADFRNRKPLKSSSLGSNFPKIMSKLIPSAMKTACTTSRSAESTTSRQGRRWSFKGIASNLRQCFHAGGRRESAESESKQAHGLDEKARKRALMSGKDNPPAKLKAASATRVGRGAKPVQNDTERMVQASCMRWARGKKKSRQDKLRNSKMGAKSSSNCVQEGQLCAESSRKLVLGTEQEQIPLPSSETGRPSSNKST